MAIKMSLKAVYEDFSACSDDFVDGVERLKEHSIPKAVESFKIAFESVGRGDAYRNKYASYCGLARVLSGMRAGSIYVVKLPALKSMMVMCSSIWHVQNGILKIVKTRLLL